jgi:two-component SAPR family response regulator
MDDYLSKPIRPDELARAISKARPQSDPGPGAALDAPTVGGSV